MASEKVHQLRALGENLIQVEKTLSVSRVDITVPDDKVSQVCPISFPSSLPFLQLRAEYVEEKAKLKTHVKPAVTSFQCQSEIAQQDENI